MRTITNFRRNKILRALKLGFHAQALEFVKKDRAVLDIQITWSAPHEWNVSINVHANQYGRVHEGKARQLGTAIRSTIKQYLKYEFDANMEIE